MARSAGRKTAAGSVDGERDWGALRIGLALAVGALLLVAVDAVAITFTVPMPAVGWWLRAAHYLADGVEAFGVGAAAGAALAVLSWLTQRPSQPVSQRRLTFAIAYVAASILLVELTIGDDLRRQAAFTPDRRFEPLVHLGLVVLAGIGTPLAHFVGALAGRRPRLRFAPVIAAILALYVDHRVFPDDFFAIHGGIAWCAATFAGAALASRADAFVLRQLARRRGRLVLGAVVATALLGVVVPPPNAVRFELFRQPCALAPWVLASTLWRSPRPSASAAPPTGPWFEPRAGLPPVAPSEPPLLASDAVVVLVTVDALRAEVLENPANEARLPAFADLRRRGVVFTRASAPASQTALSIGSIFSGRYFSELRWARYGEGPLRFLYPAGDPSPRVPELLSAAGVSTAIFKSLVFFGGDFGVVRGFREDSLRMDGARHAMAREVVDALVSRLGRARKGPLFAYVHLMDPHAPYDRGGVQGTAYERYLAEVVLVDTQIARVHAILERRLGKRWLLIVSADHGEAFGDHGTTDHGKTLYRELLDVPLLVVGPSVAPRRIDVPVSLIDLGPTLLDLFRVPVPSTFEGQSLVPLLAGRDVVLDRPILAEGRLRRSLVTPARVEVIDDPRRKLVEVYDLARDPGETRNLFGVDPRGDAALLSLRRFFAVHALTEGGYRPPYKN